MSYVTYLDVWMLGCVFFVFMELVEFTLVLGLLKVGAKSINDDWDLIWKFNSFERHLQL